MLKEIIANFSIQGTPLKVEHYGPGLINDTFLCEFLDSGVVQKYILQRINAVVFDKPDLVMHNVQTVSAHIAAKLRDQGILESHTATPTLVSCTSGGFYHRDPSGSYWRMFHFIGSGMVFDRIQNADHAREIGRALGMFHALVSDLEPSALSIPLPGFHHTPRYLAEYDKALRDDADCRAAEIAPEQRFVSHRRHLAPLLADMIESGGLPVRVVHNDPKVNNVILSAETRAALCMIDFDTVMPGTVVVDFGDCVRSAANPAGEDSADPRGAVIDLALVEAITSGYLRETRAILTPAEIAALPLAIKIIPFELGLRFLADYLRGDTYFKTTTPVQNLHRARVQFSLVESIEAAEQEIARLVTGLASS